MLLWQPKKRKHFILVSNFFVCVFLIHLLLLAPLFLIGPAKQAMHLQINLKNIDRSLPVIFVPIGQKPPARAAQKNTVAPAQAKPVSKTKAQPVVKKKEPVKTTIAKQEKKREPKKSVIAKKQEAKVQPPVAKKEPVKSPAPIVEQPKPEPIAQASPANDIRQEIDALYVNRNELEQLAIAEYIQQEVGVHWRPPVGLSPDLTCNVKIAIDRQGRVASTTIIESSGVVIFDVAVQAALMLVSCLPVWAHEREFFINFKH